jgi:hypothetical protein
MNRFFNDGAKFGVFGEMEHRSPAIWCGSAPQSITEATVATAALFDSRGLAAWQEEFLGRP